MDGGAATATAAWLALALSAASFGWQVRSWRRSGPVVRVSVRGAVLGTEPEPTFAMSVSAVNSGRAAVQVTAVTFQEAVRRPKQSLVLFRPLPYADQLPHLLEPQTTATWLYSADALGGLAAEHGAPRLRAVVDLGNGTRARSEPFPAPAADRP